MLPEQHLEEEERQRQLFKVFAKLKDLEEDKVGTTGNGSTTQASTTSFNKTVSSSTASGGFFSSNS